jgi:hypothetical protein
MKEQYTRKIHESISLAHDTFNDLHLAFFGNLELLNPLVNEISRLLANGVEPEKIKVVISRARDELQKLT